MCEAAVDAVTLRAGLPMTTPNSTEKDAQSDGNMVSQWKGNQESERVVEMGGGGDEPSWWTVALGGSWIGPERSKR